MDTIEQLANVVSRETPIEEERRDFLRQQQSPGLDDDMLNQIQQNFAEYIGPLAGRLVQHYSAETRSLEELVNRLADEIPDPDNRDNFRQHWLDTDICEKWIPCHMQKAPLTRGFLYVSGYPLLAYTRLQPLLPEGVPVISIRYLIGEAVDQLFEITCLG